MTQFSQWEYSAAAATGMIYAVPSYLTQPQGRDMLAAVLPAAAILFYGLRWDVSLAMTTAMDPSVLQQRLAEAEERIAHVERQIAQQRKIIAELDTKGRDATHARYLLAGLELLLSDRRSRRESLLEQAKSVT
jgi:uncharacterized coiled-coil protein SlyX